MPTPVPNVTAKNATNATRRPRKRTKRDRVTTLKRWGLLRHGVAKVPAFLVALEVFVVHCLHLLAHGLLVAGVATEALGGISGAQAARSAEARALSRQMGVLVFDCGLGSLQAVLALLRAVGLPILGDDGVTILRRLALLHSATAALLHFSAVVRWRRRTSSAAVPPLFSLLAYFAAPWSGLSVWLVMVRPGDHELGGNVPLDMVVECLLLLARAVFFGRHRSPRAPREPRSLGQWLLDAIVLGIAILVFDVILLRCAWLEHIRNWKYVLCAVNLAWPWPFVYNIARFFRREARRPREPSEGKADGSGTAEVQHTPSGALLRLRRASARNSRAPRPGEALRAPPSAPGPIAEAPAEEEQQEEPRLPVLGMREDGQGEVAPSLLGAPGQPAEREAEREEEDEEQSRRGALETDPLSGGVGTSSGT